ILSLIIFVPLAGAVALLFIPKEKTQAVHFVSIASAAISFIISVWALVAFDRSTAAMQFVEKAPWIPTLGVNYHLGVDGLSFPMILLTTLLTLLSLIFSMSIKERVKEYFFWFLLLDVGMLGVFAALDFVLFY